MNEIDEHGFLDITLEEEKNNIQIGLTDKLILGSTLNNILKGQFILFSHSNKLKLILKGGIDCWIELCETIFIMLNSFITIQQIFKRIFILILRSLTTKTTSTTKTSTTSINSLIKNDLSPLKNNKKGINENIINSSDKDLAYGGLCFTMIWIQHFTSFISRSNIIEMYNLLEEYVEYINSLGFSKNTLKLGGIGVYVLEKLYYLHDLVKLYALSSNFCSISIKLDLIKGTWNRDDDKKFKSNNNNNNNNNINNKKPFKDDKKRNTTLLSTSGTRGGNGNESQLTSLTTKSKNNTQMPTINIFGVTQDMLNDDDDNDDWDSPPPPLLLTSHLNSSSNDNNNNNNNNNNDNNNFNDELIDDDPKRLYPLARIPIGTSLLQDTFQTDLWSFDLLEIARQWTLIDHEKYISIPLSSYYNCEWSLPRHQQGSSIYIRQFIDQFNSQSCWITETIITCENIEKRAQIYEKYIELAGYLELLNNFNGVMAILTGLQQGCITRLKDMIQLVDDHSIKQLQRLQSLMSGSKNYQQYREVLILRSAALPTTIEDWTYNNYIIDEKLEGYDTMTRRESHRHTPQSHDGITGIVPHLGAHLAELTTISEGNSTYLLDAPHLLNLEKKRLFARCLSQLRRLSGMRYQLRSIRLIQSILYREFYKGLHLSSQNTSDWSRKMYQLSLELDKKEEIEKDNESEQNEENNMKFTRPTLSKARSLLGGNWSSTRRLSVEPDNSNDNNNNNNSNNSNNNNISLSVDILPNSKPSLLPSKSFRNDSMISQISTPLIHQISQSTNVESNNIQSSPRSSSIQTSLPSPIQITSQITTSNPTLTGIAPPPSSLSSPSINPNLVSNPSQTSNPTSNEKKKRGLGKLFTVLKMSKRKSNDNDNDNTTNNNGDRNILVNESNNLMDLSKLQNNDELNSVNRLTKEKRKMLL